MADIATRPEEHHHHHHQQPPNNNNPILGFLSNFLKLFNLPLPFLPPPPPPAKTNQLGPEEPTNITMPVVAAEAPPKPAVVKFPRPSEESLPSIKLEADEVEERNTNPVVLWQVYAIGGFLVLKWAWTRWNERRDRKKPSDDNRPPAVE